ncbi:hypothetical protein [Curtobacterium sp. MCPF17_003]|uniref:hypothetical protein n=1 Tax=Curtobacterium sp. MCPF17_003 TaxID=2175637 RepID=UPI0021ACE514|nr:hypothetical protein [Curtobacterium sp. MCPF17_003]
MATDVAMAFAVSWKPFVKSNTRATTITSVTMTMTSMRRTVGPPGTPCVNAG